jgi:signal peptidase I
VTETNKKTSILSEIKSLLLVIFFALLVRIFVIELFFVPTTSMKATILENDYIFSTKYNYGFSKYTLPFSPNLFEGRIFASTPERGDIIIMRPPHDMTTRFIKRLIGLPGDTVQIKNDVTYINNVPIERVEIGPFFDENDREYIKYKETLANGLAFYTYKLRHNYDDFGHDYSNFGPFTVPANQFFFLGDNRDESGDSRFQLGFVPFENLIGKAQFILFSTSEVLWKDHLGLVDQVTRFGTWIASIRYNRLFKGMYSVDK